MKIIVSTSYRDYLDVCHANGFNCRNRSKYRFVDNAGKLNDIKRIARSDVIYSREFCNIDVTAKKELIAAIENKVRAYEVWQWNSI